MKHNLTPIYLSALVPQAQSTPYVTPTTCKLYIREQLFNSFLLSTVMDWNNFASEGRQIDNVNTFKQFPKQSQSITIAVVVHTRLQTNCSGLSNNLFLKNISESPLRQCRRLENAYHYFFECPFYVRHRIARFTSLSQRYNVTLNLLLSGEASQSYEANLVIFEEKQKYIIDTKRFG